MPRALRRRGLDSGLTWSVLAGLVFAALGFLTGFGAAQAPVTGLFVDEFGLPALVFSGLVALGAFLLGSGCWWLVVERPGRVTRNRGALVGLLTGLLAHPVTWVLVVAYLDLRAGRTPFGDGAFSFAFLFFHFGLAITGTFTVAFGVCGGLAVTLLRERASAESHGDRRNPFAVAVMYVVGGLLLHVVVLATSLWFPALVGAGLLAAGTSALATRRLPVVRTFLLRSYRKPTAGLADGPFLVRHVAAAFGVELLFVVGGVVAYALASPVDSFYWYPIAFLGVALPAALALNYRRSGWEPARSLRRAALEWAAFLGVAVTSYTAAFVFYLDVVLPALG